MLNIDGWELIRGPVLKLWSLLYCLSKNVILPFPTPGCSFKMSENGTYFNIIIQDHAAAFNNIGKFYISNISISLKFRI